MRLSVKSLSIAALSAALLTAPLAAAECDDSMFSGRYGLSGDGYSLFDFHGRPAQSPVALVALIESDGQGHITHWKEMLLSEAQFDDEGEMTHDGTLLRNYHELFSNITYEVSPDCTFTLKVTTTEFETGLFGLLVDGGRQAFVLSEMDENGVVEDVASGMLRKLDIEAGGTTGRVASLEAKVDAMAALLRLMAQRMSIVIPE